MTPKKIFGKIREDWRIKINIGDFSDRKFLGYDVPYILESEHNRIVEELKAENERLTSEVKTKVEAIYNLLDENRGLKEKVKDLHSKINEGYKSK